MMAYHNEQLGAGKSGILEEDGDDDNLKLGREIAETSELLVERDAKKMSFSDKYDAPRLLLNDEEYKEAIEEDGADANNATSSVSQDVDSPKKDEDISKSVTFADDVEVFDLNNQASVPMTVCLDSVMSNADTKIVSGDETTKDSAAVLPVVGDGSTHLSRPSDLTLSSQTSTKDQPSSTTEKSTQEVEHTGHRHFDVSNVDESELRRQNEMENKDADLDALKLDLESRPLLDKRPSNYSDGQGTYRANQDTIGPLENPTFLKMLNYSVNQPVEDDAFAATSLADLENMGDAQPLSEMDSGWAWVILFAAFSCLSLTGATMFAAGVLMPTILEQIENNVTKASWIGAVHISITCMSGPFVGIILNCLGARLTAFLAGFVLATGLVAAAFANSIIELIFTHGLVAGIGSGFILNTMFVIVGQYFNRYRGLACGVLATGSGAGMLAGGSILTALFNKFGLSGTYMLWGGVTLHSVIFSLLLRPSPEERSREEEKKMALNPDLVKTQEFQGDLNSMMSGLNSLYGADQHSMFSGRTSSVHRVQKYPTRLSKQDVSVAPLLKTVLHRDMSRSMYSVATNRSARSHIRSNMNIPASPTVAHSKSNLGSAAIADNLNTPYTPSPGSTPMAHSPMTCNPLTSQDQGDQNTANEKLDTLNQDNIQPFGSGLITTIPEKDVADLTNQPSSPTNSRAPSGFNSSFRKRLLSGSSQTPSQYTSTGRLSYRPSIREQLHRNDLDNESLASTLVSHLQPSDALNPRYRLGSRSISSMMGSIASFPTALAIVKDDLARIEATEVILMGPRDYLIRFLDSLRLLRNKPFLVFITTCMLWALADAPFSLYLPVYAISQGSSRMQAASLYTGMGFGSMCGRFLSGLVASDSDIGPVLLHIGCLGVASLIVSFSPLFTSTYFGQLICSALFGLYTGSLVPLSSLITIELLGIGELGLGFGFLSMAQGIGYLAGPPLLGVGVQYIGYASSFLVIGFIFISASILAMMIAILLRNATVEEEDIHDSFEDLERALRRISDTEGEDGSDDETGAHEDDQQTKPIISASVYGANSKTKEELVTSSVDDTSPHDDHRDNNEEAKVVPLVDENVPAELETISEEA